MAARLVLVLAALGAAGAVAGGCGTADDRDAVRDVTTRFYAAVEAGDGGAACELLADDTLEPLESQTGQACDDVITRLELEAGEVEHVEVFNLNGRAVLSSGGSAFLSDEPEGWRLSAIGCSPEEGKPRDRPFDCEVEA